jgi:predicted ArsR family transcriptional regulator
MPRDDHGAVRGALHALAHPARAAFVRHLRRSPANVDELADAAGVHTNTARRHLAALEAEGVVEREAQRSGGRGRPTWRWRLTDRGHAREVDYRELASLLATVLGRGAVTRSELRAAATEWGAWTQEKDRAVGIAPALDVLRRAGVDATVKGDALTLARCPCAIVSPANPRLVCHLLLDAAEGALGAAGTGLRIEQRHHDPEHRRCSAVVRAPDRPSPAA